MLAVNDMMNVKKTTMIGIVAVSLLAGFFLYQQSVEVTVFSLNEVPNEAVETSSKAMPKNNANADDPIAASSKIAFSTWLENPPEYLKGTDFRGALPIDGNNELILHRKIKQRFDYFFLMSGELSHDEIVSIIEGHLHSELEGAALIKAVELLHAYSQYLIEYERLTTDVRGDSVPDRSRESLQTLMADIHQLRINTLGEQVVDAFFAQEAWLQQQSLGQDNGADATRTEYQKDISERQAKTLAYENKKAFIEARVAEDSTSEALRTARLEAYGEQATKRLEALDASRTLFQNQLNQIKAIQSEQKDNGLSSDENERMLVQTLMEAGVSERRIERLLAVARNTE